MIPQAEPIGRARVVLVSGSGDGAVSVLSTVVAHVRDGGGRLAFSGPAVFDADAREHLEDVVLPAVDRILGALAQAAPNYDLSLANVGAASGNDVGVRVSGFSADVPVALALLSAALGIPVPSHLVSTGHLASTDGDITIVRSIPAKLRAAAADPGITQVVLPDISGDSSLCALLPGERDAIAGAIAAARLSLAVLPVKDLSACIRAAFDEEAVLLSGLRLGLLQPDRVGDPAAQALDAAVDYLAGGEDRFWKAVEPRLLAGEAEAGRRLLEAWAAFHVRRRTYPRGTGARLHQLLQSMPPAARRMAALFPLLERGACMDLVRLSREEDYDDVRALFLAVEGSPRPRDSAGAGRRAADGSGIAGGGGTLGLVLREIGAEALAETVGLAADTARVSYPLPAATADSYDEFLACLTSFLAHLFRHCRGLSGALDAPAMQAEAVALAERAFAGDGGLAGARAEAMHGVRGGLRHVLDVMTDTYKAEEAAKRVNLVLQQAMDPLDPEAREAFMAGLLEHLSPHLPPEIAAGPPARFARNWDTIVREYVKSMERVRGLLRSL